jgi:hypothetical protein
MSSSPTGSEIDSEVGDLSDDLLGGRPLISYVRYDLELSRSGIEPLLEPDPGPSFTDERIESLHGMDNPENTSVLFDLGRRRGRQAIASAHFPARFDLATGP